MHGGDRASTMNALKSKLKLDIEIAKEEVSAKKSLLSLGKAKGGQSLWIPSGVHVKYRLVFKKLERPSFERHAERNEELSP
jgi:hypothetical protein